MSKIINCYHSLLSYFTRYLTGAYCESVFIPTFLDSSSPFVYNYKPANFEDDFISALTALVTAQDDPQRLKELSVGAKGLLNDYQEKLPKVLKKVK